MSISETVQAQEMKVAPMKVLPRKLEEQYFEVCMVKQKNLHCASQAFFIHASKLNQAVVLSKISHCCCLKASGPSHDKASSHQVRCKYVSVGMKALASSESSAATRLALKLVAVYQSFMDLCTRKVTVLFHSMVIYSTSSW